MNISREDDELSIFAATIYSEAREESQECQYWVAWAIKNKSLRHRENFGGSTIKNVCLCADQFKCWSGKQYVTINEQFNFSLAYDIAKDVYFSDPETDPTSDSLFYYCPVASIEPDWLNKVKFVNRIGYLNFYKEE
jgi:hypothetical protein